MVLEKLVLTHTYKTNIGQTELVADKEKRTVVGDGINYPNLVERIESTGPNGRPMVPRTHTHTHTYRRTCTNAKTQYKHI